MENRGYVVGTTRSGKAIYCFAFDEVLDDEVLRKRGFSADDHFDASAVFEALALREKRRHGESSVELLRFLKHLKLHAEVPELVADYDGTKRRAGCRDAFDIGNLGRRLAKPEFQDV
jgi:hypothetical protein